MGRGDWVLVTTIARPRQASDRAPSPLADDEGVNATILYSELQASATPCESVLQFAGSLGAVAQWLELGTHNPPQSDKNAVKDRVSALLAHLLSLNAPKSLVELVGLWWQLDDASRLDLLACGRRLLAK